MYLDPSALLLADRSQRRHVESVRLDTPGDQDRRRVFRRRPTSRDHRCA
ncbi:MAG TPA: hypothetical protein VIU11_11285 [Nakamurella sp.]